MENIGGDMYQYKSCGLDGIYLENGYHETVINGSSAVSITALDSLHEAIAMNICSLPRSLNGKEIRFLRTELDMSQKGLGLWIDKTDQAIAKWEKDENDIPRADDACLRNLYLDSRDKDSKLSELLKRFNEIDREMQEQEKTVFIESEEQWQVAC